MINNDSELNTCNNCKTDLKVGYGCYCKKCWREKKIEMKNIRRELKYYKAVALSGGGLDITGFKGMEDDLKRLEMNQGVMMRFLEKWLMNNNKGR